jgi:hypothetical protein
MHGALLRRTDVLVGCQEESEEETALNVDRRPPRGPREALAAWQSASAHVLPLMGFVFRTRARLSALATSSSKSDDAIMRMIDHDPATLNDVRAWHSSLQRVSSSCVPTPIIRTARARPRAFSMLLELPHETSLGPNLPALITHSMSPKILKFLPQPHAR